MYNMNLYEEKYNQALVEARRERERLKNQADELAYPESNDYIWEAGAKNED